MKIKVHTENVVRKHYGVRDFGNEDSLSLRFGKIVLNIKRNPYHRGLDFYPEFAREPCLCLKPIDCMTIPSDADENERGLVVFTVEAKYVDKIREALKDCTFIAPAREDV